MGASGSLKGQSHLLDVPIHIVLLEETCITLSTIDQKHSMSVQTLGGCALLFIAGMSYRGL